jgi:hypothetical protein
MKLDPNYPRMLFHRSLPPVTVQSQSEEQALGPEWSRTIPGTIPGTIPVPKSAPPVYPPEPEKPEEDEPPEPEEDEPEEEQPEEERQPLRPPLRKPAPKPVKPAATRQRRQH